VIERLSNRGSGPSALDLAVRALAGRGLSEAEVRARLRRASVPATVEDETIGTLVRLGYVDDLRLAHERATSLADRGYGDAIIEERLVRAGVPRATAREALTPLESEMRRARRLARAGPRRSAPQLARFLSRRGFGEETIETVLDGAADLDAPGAPTLP
jgi:regulatory protein